MRRNLFTRVISSLMIVSYAASAIGADRKSPALMPLVKAQIATKQIVGDFGSFYEGLSKAYQTKGPEAFVGQLDFVQDKVGRERILQRLAKLPTLPELTSCGDSCLEFIADSKRVRVEVGDLVVGGFKINGEDFRIDFAKDSFHKKVEEVEAYLTQSLVSLPGGGSLVSDLVARVCRVLLPEAHAEMSKTTKAILIGVAAIVAVLAIWWIGKKLINRAEKKAQNVVREADRRAKRRINQANSHAEDRINQASEEGKAIIDEATSNGQKIIEDAKAAAPVTNTSADPDASDDGGAAPDGTPHIGDSPRGDLRN
jgi:vacuolar-type H+-ATPase subunit H